jgi:hypothetical protein
MIKQVVRITGMIGFQEHQKMMIRTISEFTELNGHIKNTSKWVGSANSTLQMGKMTSSFPMDLRFL